MSLRTLALLARGRLAAGSGWSEDEHPLQIPRHRHEAPLAAHFVEAAQRKLPESERRFDRRRIFRRGPKDAESGR